MSRAKLVNHLHQTRLGLFLVLVFFSTATNRETAVLHARPPSPDITLQANIAIEKTPDTQEIAQGGTANFTIQVTNTGTVDLQNVNVSDPLTPDCDKSIGSLNVGSSSSYSCQLSGVNNSFLNEATVTAQAVGSGEPTSDSDTAFVSVDNPTIKIIKSPDPQTVVKNNMASFSIIVLNTSSSVDLRDVAVTDPLTPSCDKTIGNLNHGASHSYSCQSSPVASAFTNIANVVGTNINNGQQVNGSDAAAVEVLDLAIDYSVDPTSLQEPGGPAEYTVVVTNDSSVEVTFDTLTSNRYGDLMDSGNSKVQNNNCAAAPGNLSANGGTFTCTFQAILNSQPGTISDTATATATAVADSVSVSANDSAVITITDVPPSITVTVTADPEVVQAPGGSVTFTVDVNNNSNVESVTLISLSDTLVGNLNSQGSCTLPTIAAQASYQCTYTASVTGTPGSKVNTVTATGNDDDGGTTNDSDQATVIITEIPDTYIPIIFNNYVVGEPNNTCQEAYPIIVNSIFSFLPDDVQDWYWFDLATTSNVVVQLTNFQPVAGQIVAYSAADGTCSTLQFLMNNGDFSTTKILNLGSLAPGRYFVRVITDGPLSNTVPYQLHVVAP